MMNRITNFVYGPTHLKLAAVGAVIGANVCLCSTDNTDGFIGPMLVGAWTGAAVVMSAPITIPIAVLCTPSIIYKKYLKST